MGDGIKNKVEGSGVLGNNGNPSETGPKYGQERDQSVQGHAS